jgi:hypothetical protein
LAKQKENRTFNILIWNTALALSVKGMGRPPVNSKKSPSNNTWLPFPSVP